jgi:hypothetical protein
MSASLIVLIPLVLLGLVTALCFVGCAQVIGLQPWQSRSYQSTVSGDPNMVALWPLNDVPPSTTALATPPSFSGNYIEPVTPRLPAPHSRVAASRLGFQSCSISRSSPSRPGSSRPPRRAGKLASWWHRTIWPRTRGSYFSQTPATSGRSMSGPGRTSCSFHSFYRSWRMAPPRATWRRALTPRRERSVFSWESSGRTPLPRLQP